MSDLNSKLPLSKKNQREISPFIGHELLYDYLSGNLDKDRRTSVEDYVKFSRDAQTDLLKIKKGQSYAEKLSGTVVSQPIIAQISAPTSYLSVLMQKANFDKWPQGLKWGLEALVVMMAIVIVLTITPWQKVMQLGMSSGPKEVVLAEVSKTATVSNIEETPQFIDEGVKDVPKGKTKEVAKTPEPVKAPDKPKESKEPKETETKVVTAPQKETKPAAEPTAAAATVATGGFLYRGELSVTNLEVVGPKITEKITELGGRKAGSVELGWEKVPGEIYYHLTIPEAKYTELLNFLSTYGKPRISKEKHPRIMPDGIIRLILTVGEAKK
ncbi:MAG: hypothetical protein ACXVCP_06400 [Bdellovibrio sp.]